MFVFLVCLVLVALESQASIGEPYEGEPQLYAGYQGEYASAYDNYVPKPYSFEYGVSDPHTGDHKTQWETKDTSGVVRGSYSLREPDGTTRIVDYIADDHGFRAVVKKIGIHGHAESIQNHGDSVDIEQPKVLAPIVAAEPVQLQEPVQLEQTAIVKQPAIYFEESPAFRSYDGGIQNYLNLVPYQGADVVYKQTQKQDLGYIQAAREEIGAQRLDLGAERLELGAPRLDIGPPRLDLASKLDISAPRLDIGAPRLDLGAYNQQTYFEPNPQLYVQPQPKEDIILRQNTAIPKATIYTQQPQYVIPQNKVVQTYQQAEMYQPPVLSVSISSPNYQQYPVEQNRITIPAYEGNVPVSNYQLEQTFGGQPHIWAEQPRIYEKVKPQELTNSHVSLPNSIISNSQSFQNVQSSTNHREDDSQYTNYDGNAGISLNQGEYIPSTGNYQNTFKYKRSLY